MKTKKIVIFVVNATQNSEAVQTKVKLEINIPLLFRY